MSNRNFDVAYNLTTNNKFLLNSYGDYCGCFKCCSVYLVSEIKSYTNDDSAICPYCGNDYVLPDILETRISKNFLKKLSAFWFGV